jgi:GxxExxY protein
MEFDDLSSRIIGCAIEVDRHLVSGLLKSACEPCLAHELSRNKIAFRLQLARPVRYLVSVLDCGYQCNIRVEHQLSEEFQSCEQELAIHEARLLTCMESKKVKIGLLMNSNVTKMKASIGRFAHEFASCSSW